MKGILNMKSGLGVLAVALFLASLYPQSIREAHVLCARCLLHLKGETFVQGNPAGCIVYIIPNVQFTERHREGLRSRSMNSLDDFVLASTTGEYFGLGAPTAVESWSNHPLLEWAAIRLAWTCLGEYPVLNSTNLPTTNAVAPVGVTNALRALEIAQKADPTNGALWLAEAFIHFTQRKDQAALAALRIAATNRIWKANKADTYSYTAGLLTKSGLSELDAAISADNLSADMSFVGIQSKCMRSLDELMLAAVNVNDTEKLAILLKVLTELRRAGHYGHGEFAMNSFRGYRGSDELINAMARQMGKNPLPDSGKVPYEERSQLQEQIFGGYTTRVADEKTVAIFVTQSEDYRTERQLRTDSHRLRSQSLMRSAGFSMLTGSLALLALSLLVIAILFEVVILLLRRIPSQIGKLPRRKEFWIVASLALIVSTAVFFNFINACGITNEIGFDVEDRPPPLISESVGAVLGSLLVCGTWLAALLANWNSGKARLGPLRTELIFAFAYLASIALMAWCRVETVANIIAGMQ